MRAQMFDSELVFKESTGNVVDRRVALIQRWLKLRQSPALNVDGLFGQKTTMAVKTFQHTAGLKQSGVVDRTTGRKMGLPFWDVSVQRKLETPFRDENVFDSSHEFTFRSSVGAGYFYSSWPDTTYDSTDGLTWRALRTNNPGAINISRWQRRLSGYVGKTRADGVGNETTIYQTPEEGIAAWGILLRVIYFRGSKDKVTIGQIVDKYRGGNPRSHYLEGYKRFSNGELTEDFEVDLYDSALMRKVAIASYSHEFGSWYPLLDEQLLAGLAVLDAYVPFNGESLITVPEEELTTSFYQTDVTNLAGLNVEGRDDAEEFEESVDRLGPGASIAVPQTEGFTPPMPHLGVSDARWPSEFKNAPDMWHISGDGSDVEFELTYPVVNRLLEVGCFEPDTFTNGKFILALRGCVIADGSAQIENSPSIKFRATKPNHEDFLCSLGVIDTGEQRLSFYKASTVPRRTGMLRFYNKINFGQEAMNCNMLGTGCYEYCVGTHHGHAGDVTFVLRLGNGPEPNSAGSAVVLRTTNDLIYGTRDLWDPTTPADNIHPAFLAVSFSSVGCLTVHGYQEPGGDYSTATQQWKAFRKNVGFEGDLRGKRFDTVIVTGHEAAAVAAIGGAAIEGLLCLRQGSRGAIVARLQEQLGLAADGKFGTMTAKALVVRQRDKLGFATATWTAQMAAALGMNF